MCLLIAIVIGAEFILIGFKDIFIDRFGLTDCNFELSIQHQLSGFLLFISTITAPELLIVGYIILAVIMWFSQCNDQFDFSSHAKYSIILNVIELVILSITNCLIHRYLFSSTDFCYQMKMNTISYIAISIIFGILLPIVNNVILEKTS